MRGGGGMRSGGMRSSSMSRPSSGMSSRPSGGFDFSGRDLKPVQRPGGGGLGEAGTRPGVGEGAGGRPGSGERPGRPGSGEGIGNRPGNGEGIGNRPPGNPVVPPGGAVPPAWGWNGGVAWYPAPIYYGGGFWGPWAVGVGTTAILYGAYENEETKEKTESYEVAPDSPGAKTLAAYGLVQKPCGSENQVIIHGPENSVVCADPNQTVAAGNYKLDTETLTLYSPS